MKVYYKKGPKSSARFLFAEETIRRILGVTIEIEYFTRNVHCNEVLTINYAVTIENAVNKFEFVEISEIDIQLGVLEELAGMKLDIISNIVTNYDGLNHIFRTEMAHFIRKLRR